MNWLYSLQWPAWMPDPKRVAELVLDKALLGGALAIGAYLFARALERFRAHASLRNEMLKKRFDVLADVLEKMRHLELVCVSIEPGLRVEHDLGLRLNEAQRALIAALGPAQVYLDQDDFKHLVAKQTALVDEINARANGTPEDVARARARRDLLSNDWRADAPMRRLLASLQK